MRLTSIIDHYRLTRDELADGRGSRRRRFGRLSRAVALVASALLAGGAVAGPALADGSFTAHVTPGNTFDLLLDVSGASTQPGAPAIDWYANGGANQTWTFSPDGGPNTYEIINQNSQQCLTTDGVAGDQLYQLPCAGAGEQLWTTSLNLSTPFDKGEVISNVSSGLVIDVNGDNAWPGASIDTWYYNGGPNQFFSLL